MSRRPDDRVPDGPGPLKPGRRPAKASASSGAGPGGSRGPKPLADLLGDLFAARGLARVRAHREVEEAWAGAVGETGRLQTRVEGLRRGVLNVVVAHPTLLEELASFQKPQLLASLRRSLGAAVLDIRFRVGPVEAAGPSKPGR